MRTPSIYSQDDPLSAVLKPSPTETEAERSARLVREADAKRISEQIDEDLRLEREKLKRRKGDVKVCHVLLHIGRIYLQLLLIIAVTARSSGKRQIDSSETIPADVQAQHHRSGAHLLENCHLL
jgi:hypothetical protein